MAGRAHPPFPPHLPNANFIKTDTKLTATQCASRHDLIFGKGKGWTCLWGQRSQTNAFAFVVSCHSASIKEATIDMEGGNTNGTEYTAEKKWFEKVMSRRETREKISFFSKMNEWDFLYCAQVIEDLHCIGLGRRNTGSVGLCVDRKTSELTQKNATITTTDTDTN